MGALFVYWYADSRDHRDFVRYEIYFDGTVSGLTEGGPVRYLGVDVGRVQRIRIDPRADNRVQIVADIDSTTPVSDRTLAQLSLQGVTGLLYIDLQQQRSDDYRRAADSGAERALPGHSLGAFRPRPVPEQPAEPGRAPQRPVRSHREAAVRRQRRVRSRT